MEWVRWKMISYHTCRVRFSGNAKVVVVGKSKAFDRGGRKGKAAKVAKKTSKLRHERRLLSEVSGRERRRWWWLSLHFSTSRF